MFEKRSQVVMPDEGPSLWMLGDHAVPKLSGLNTAGTLAIAVITCPPGSGPAPHVHASEDEFFYVLDGQFDFLCNDLAYRGAAGSAVYSRRGTLHTFRNSADRPSRLLLGVLPPGGFEQFVLALATPAVEGEPTPLATPDLIERFCRLAPHYGITMVPDAAPPRQTLPLPAAATHYRVLGDQVTVLCDERQSGGLLSAVEVQAAPGNGPPPHVHRDADETFFVLDGALELQLDDRVARVGRGTLAYVAAGTPHTYHNASSQPARFLAIATPGGLEKCFADLHGADAGDAEKVMAICRRHGMDFPQPLAPG
jgi:quercetin dioxygenase-like cupin family protein